MKLGYLSRHNALDRNAFSGSSYYMYHSLRANRSCSVRLLGDPRRPNRILDRLNKDRSNPGRVTGANFEGLDAIISLASTDLVCRFGQISSVPLIHCTDATPKFLEEFYGTSVPAEAFEMERRAYERADLVLFSSDFMLKRALSEFGAEFAPKMAALPWGANLDSLPAASPRKPPLRPVRLLFMGKDWVRKGGDTVVATLRELQARGVPAELHLVGAQPDEVGSSEGIINHGYLNKNRRADRATLERLLNSAHFLVLPTRADCTPMVIAEANSHGIPVLISDVGGIGSLMRPGWNGEMLPLNASASDYADRLVALAVEPERYGALSRNSYRHFHENLTWTAWSKALIEMVEDRFGKNPS